MADDERGFPEGINRNKIIDADEFGPRVPFDVPHVPYDPHGGNDEPPSADRTVALLSGLKGSEIAPRIPDGKTTVEANTLLGAVGSENHDPELVVQRLQTRKERTPIDRANLACAVGWLGYEAFDRGNDAAAREYWDAASKEMDLALEADKTHDLRDQLDAFAKAIEALQSLLSP